MKLTPNNKLGYLQVLISFLIIYCTIYMPIIEGSKYVYTDSYSHSYSDSLNLLYASKALKGYNELFFVLFYMALIILHLVNIFFQSKKKNTALAIASGIYSFIFFTTTLLIINSTTKENEYEDFKLIYGFFVITMLIIAQIVTAILFNKNAEVKQPSSVDNSPNKELCKKKQLEDELRQLQTQVKQIEKEEAKRKLELERAEKEKLENEKLMNEIAKLKEVIRNHENK